MFPGGHMDMIIPKAMIIHTAMITREAVLVKQDSRRGARR
jgi:hypothetical protein